MSEEQILVEPAKKFRVSKLTILSAIVSGVLTLMVMSFVFQRLLSINILQKEIVKLQNSLVEAGYDMAYENLNFSKFSLFHILTIKDFKIYAKNPKNYYEWSVAKLYIGSSLISARKLDITFAKDHKFQKDLTTYEATFPNLSIEFRLSKKYSLNSIIVNSQNMEIKDNLFIKELGITARKKELNQFGDMQPFFESYFNAKDIKLDEQLNFPLENEISRIYMNANIVGLMNAEKTYGESIDNWLQKGGMVDIKRLIVNWPPLLLVGRGDLYFNEKLQPKMRLMTSSKAFVETIDKLEKGRFIQRKGAFVAKILLNNKSFKLKEDDKHFTVTTPINISAEEILIENIPVKKF